MLSEVCLICLNEIGHCDCVKIYTKKKRLQNAYAKIIKSGIIHKHCPICSNALQIKKQGEISIECSFCGVKIYDLFGTPITVDNEHFTSYPLFGEEWFPFFDRTNIKTPQELYPRDYSMQNDLEDFI